MQRMEITHKFERIDGVFPSFSLNLMAEKGVVKWESNAMVFEVTLREVDADKLFRSFRHLRDFMGATTKKSPERDDIDSPFVDVDMVGNLVLLHMAKAGSMVLSSRAVSRGMSQLDDLLFPDDEEEEL